MKINDIFIGMKAVDTNENIHIVEEINGKTNTIICSDGWTTTPENIHPIYSQPYMSTDEFGHSSFCIQTKEGILSASIDTPVETTYTAMYIGYMPKDETRTYKDIVRVRDCPNPNELEINLWEEELDDPTYNVRVNADDICPEKDY